jgi:hypothetical protein
LPKLLITKIEWEDSILVRGETVTHEEDHSAPCPFLQLHVECLHQFGIYPAKPLIFVFIYVCAGSYRKDGALLWVGSLFIYTLLGFELRAYTLRHSTSLFL